MKMFAEEIMNEVQIQVMGEKMESAATRTLKWYMKSILQKLDDLIHDKVTFGHSTRGLEKSLECVLNISKEMHRVKWGETSKNNKDIMDETIHFLLSEGINDQAEQIKVKYKSELFEELN